MIRYPKRNVARTGPKKPASIIQQPKQIVRPQAPIKERQKSTGQIMSRDEHSFQEYAKITTAKAGKWENILYPAGLAQLHLDIDKLVYETVDKDQEQRIPPNLKQLEALADKLLCEFIDAKLELESPGEYYAQVREAMSNKSLMMFAYRCAIAALDVNGELIDSLEIYVSEAMNGWDFPLTYGDDNVKLYEHSENFALEREIVSKRENKKELTARDQMPDFALDAANQLLLSLGRDPITGLKAAWKELSQVSRTSGVEDRILSRIAYLIANSIFTRAQTLLDNDGRTGTLENR